MPIGSPLGVKHRASGPGLRPRPAADREHDLSPLSLPPRESVLQRRAITIAAHKRRSEQEAVASAPPNGRQITGDAGGRWAR